MSRPVARPPLPWQAGLASLGFHPLARGAGYGHQESSFRVRSGWGTLESKRRRADPLRGLIGKPGLWKCVVDDRDGRVRQVFDFPPAILCASHSSHAHEANDDVFRESIGWALATAGGSQVEGWSAPAPEEAAEWVDAELLTIRVGSILRQVSLRHGPDWLTLTAPILNALEPDLDPVRAGWLHELLIDAQNRWPMVRVGFAADSAVHAEVDLSGAPHAAIDQLFKLGVDGLRNLIEWIVQPADFLASDSVCRALEIRTPRASPA